MKDTTLNTFQKSLVVWPLLVLAAKTQTILSYKMVQEMTGIFRHGELREVLGNIYFYCKKKRWPLINMLVIPEEEGEPQAKVFGDEDTATEHRRSFIFDWANKYPSEKTLEEARAWGEKAQAA